jgi:hypothetical protein
MPEPTMFEQFTNKHTPPTTTKLKLGEDGYWDQQLSDGDWMSGAAQFGGLAMNLASLPMQYKSAKLQNEGMQLDIDGVRADRANQVRKSEAFNSIRSSTPSNSVSAFVDPNRTTVA